MPSIQGAQAYWEPGPASRPVRGLFDAAEVETFTDPHLTLGAEYQTNRCTAGRLWADYCAGTGKTFSDLQTVKGSVFAAYDGVQCSLGMDRAEQEGRLREAFDAKAEAVVEAQLEAVVKAASAAITITGQLPDLVGELEARLAAGYAGRGILHMDRFTGTVAASRNLLEAPSSNDAPAQTYMGTRVALGRGYSRAASKYWAAVTGRVVVLRGPLEVYMAPSTVAQPQRLLAEQPIVLLVECATAWGEIGVTR